jgi:Fur family ferric uptake transcriptional regulator
MQKRRLTEFMTKNYEKSFSVEELVVEMEREYSKEFAPGKSTIYRLIQKMTEEGLVKRLVGEHDRKFTYQIAAGEHCAYHLHMKCTDCGRLLHMDDDESSKIMKEIFKTNNFKIDERQTVLVGKCRDCKDI